MVDMEFEIEMDNRLTAHMALAEKKDKLWELCQRFITAYRITCSEATVEDRVYEHAPELVEQISEIVGYHEYPD
jgi:hypothetical protein